MEHQKILNLLNEANGSKFVARFKIKDVKVSRSES